MLCRILARTIHKDLRYPVAFFFQKGSFKIVGKVFKVIQSHGCNQRPLFGTASRTLSVAKEGPSACAEGVGQGFGSSGNRIDSVLIDIILLLRKLWGKLCTLKSWHLKLFPMVLLALLVEGGKLIPLLARCYIYTFQVSPGISGGAGFQPTILNGIKIKRRTLTGK